MSSTSHKRAQRARRHAERELIEGVLVHPNPGPGHGSRTAYTDYGCRCLACTRAQSDYQTRSGASRRNQAKRLAERELVDGVLVHPDPYGGHGSLAAYTQCGCRCAACKAAHGVYAREYYRRGRATGS